MTLIQPERADRKRIRGLGIRCEAVEPPVRSGWHAISGSIHVCLAPSVSTVRVGLLNIMPRAHAYEVFLLQALAAVPVPVRPVYVRLATHAYRSTPETEMARYRCWEEVADIVDGLLLTGAPVEHLPFEQVRYWPELNAILDEAERRELPVLGICWGGIVVAARMGIVPERYPGKVFGLFEGYGTGGVDLSGDGSDRFVCPHSRFAGLDPEAVAAACRAGTARLLATGPESGPFIVESPDGLLLGHLGHPEYPAGRLEEEWERDRAAGRAGVGPPVGLSGREGRMLWSAHRERILTRWLDRVRNGGAARWETGVQTTGGA